MGLFEDYLQNRPLSEQNARLMSDDGGPEPVPEAVQPAAAAPRRQFGNDEREWLRRLTVEPGYPILLGLLEEMINAREQSAILLSRSDPLANESNLAREWAYVAAMREVFRLVKARIDAELRTLEQYRGSGNGEVLGE